MKFRPLAAASLLLPLAAACSLQVQAPGTTPTQTPTPTPRPRPTATATAAPTPTPVPPPSPTAGGTPVATSSPTSYPALKGIHVAKPVDDGTYDRTADFGEWSDAGGCDERDRILKRDLTNVVTSDGCDVKSGILHDPYSGQTIDFNDQQYWTIQIDHIYPLHLAYEMGAEAWTKDRREAFANDPANLLAVDSHANESKGDSGPGEWVPANKAFGCTYGRKYAAVATKYDLPVTKADLASLRDLLSTCQ